MPSDPKKETKKETTEGVEIVDSEYLASSNGVEYHVIHAAFPADFMKIVLEDKEIMQKSAEEGVKGIEAKSTVTNKENITFEGRPGSTFTYISKNGESYAGRAKIVWADTGSVQMLATAKTEEELSTPEVRAFFDSIKLTKDAAPAAKR
jgi:hypothetical protein